MADMALIQGAISGLKTAFDIATGISKLNTMAEVNAKAIELQQIILSAQTSAFAANSEQFVMIQRIRDLEEEIARVKAWEEQKKRYKLVNPWEGAVSVVYALKASCKDSEPAHWICTKCYDDGRRTVLQPREDKNRYILLVCPTCNSEIHSGFRGIASATYAID